MSGYSGNPNLFFVGTTQKIAVSGTSAQSAAIVGEAVSLYASGDCWVAVGANPTAAATAGANVFIPAGMFIDLPWRSGEKLAAIQDSAAGSLHVYPRWSR